MMAAFRNDDVFINVQNNFSRVKAIIDEVKETVNHKITNDITYLLEKQKKFVKHAPFNKT